MLDVARCVVEYGCVSQSSQCGTFREIRSQRASQFFEDLG